MLLTQQVVNGLDGVERSKRYFDEAGVPVAHGTVPQTRQFKSLQFLAVLRLRRDEASGAVNEVGQVERLALIVFHCTDQVYRVEVGSLCEHLHVFLVVLVYLRRLQDLQTDSAVLVIGQEWATARLTYVLHHTTDTHGTVQFLLQVVGQLLVVQRGNIGTTAESMLNEVLDFA